MVLVSIQAPFCVPLFQPRPCEPNREPHESSQRQASSQTELEATQQRKQEAEAEPQGSMGSFPRGPGIGSLWAGEQISGGVPWGIQGRIFWTQARKLSLSVALNWWFGLDLNHKRNLFEQYLDWQPTSLDIPEENVLLSHCLESTLLFET